MQSVSKIMWMTSLISRLLLPLVLTLVSAILITRSLLSDLSFLLLCWRDLTAYRARLCVIGSWCRIIVKATDSAITQFFSSLVFTWSLMIGDWWGSLEVVILLRRSSWGLLMVLLTLLIGWACPTNRSCSSGISIRLWCSNGSCTWSIIYSSFLLTMIVKLDILIKMTCALGDDVWILIIRRDTSVHFPWWLRRCSLI